MSENLSVKEKALKLHKDNQGKLEVISKVPVNTKEDLSLAYTPGVAEPCLKIKENYDDIYEYTSKGNIVAVVTNGTAVLGLGDIGAGAGLPVMEGKAVLFKTFAGVDAFPICLNSKNVDEIINTVKLMEPSFGGINLEDIKAPECLEIERRLKEEMNIPVFHDDQHGTAIVVLAAIINSLKVTKRNIADAKFVINGAGSAGISIAKLLMRAGAKHVTMVDRIGIIEESQEWMNDAQKEIAKVTNREHLTGTLADAVKGADAFIGVSAPGVLTKEMVSTMAKDSIVFAMANPVPEIFPDEAKAGGALVAGTGRSDYPNQINNVLAFPGIFKGALEARVPSITPEMKVAVAKAIADTISDEDLNEENIMPKIFNKDVTAAVADAIKQFAK